MQLLVLGMHRSGTSAVTRLINMMGAYFGPEGSVFRPDGNNPAGYWERKDILALNGQILQMRRCSWFDIGNWQQMSTASLPTSLLKLMGATIHDLDAHRPWVLKDPRFCITLHEWLPLLEAAVAVVTSRDPIEVARSLQSRHDVSLSHGLALWEQYAVSIVKHSASLPKVFVHYDALMNKPVEAAARLLSALQAEGVRRIELPSSREVLAFIDPKLHRARGSIDGVSLSDHQRLLKTMLRGEVSMDPEIEVSPESTQLMKTMSSELRVKFSQMRGT